MDEDQYIVDCEYDDLRTSEDWSHEYGYTILDPDGWDRRNYQWSWFVERITSEEFEARAMLSTCMFPEGTFQ